MIDVKVIIKELRDTEKLYEKNFQIEPKEKRRLNKRMLFLKNALLYLETSPKQDFVEKQIESARKAQRAYFKAYKETPESVLTSDQLKKYRSQLKSDFQPGKLKAQIELLGFILQ